VPAIERLRTAEERSRKRLEQAEIRLIGYDAQELIAAAERINDVPVVVQKYDDRTLEQLRLLARQVAELGGIALLGLKLDKAQLVFTRPANLPFDMGALLRNASTIVGGRGGGKPDAAQGGGPDATRLDEALQAARDELRRMAGSE
jgi:alanyl-tRNA synthetase